MRGMLWLLVASSPAWAQQLQPTLKPIERFPSFGGITEEQRAFSAIGLLAGQVVNELHGVKVEANRSKIPAIYKPALVKLIDQSISSAESVRSLANRNANLQQLRQADVVLDAANATMAGQVSRFGVYSPGMMEALARAQYADQQLHAALHQHGGGGNVAGAIERIRRSASLLDNQAEALRDLTRNFAEGQPQAAGLDRAARTFSFRSVRFNRAADEAPLPAQLTDSFADLLRQWRGVGTAMAGVREPHAVRMQATRIEGTMRTLADLVPPPAGGWDWGQPGPRPPGFLNRGAFAVGAGSGGGPRVRVFTGVGGDATYDFFAYAPDFVGGVRVAVADLSGDGVPDLVTAPGPGMMPLVRVFDGRTMRLLTEFLAFEQNWTGGVFVAAADRTRDGRSWVAASADNGAGPHVKVFDLAAGKEIDSFFAYDQRFRGGARVALGDVNGDGLPDVLTVPGPGLEPRVKVFDGRNRNVIADFLAFDRNYTLGLSITAADLTANGRADLIVGTDAGQPSIVRVFDAVKGAKIGELTPYPQGFQGGVRVATHDFNGDGVPDVACAPGRDGNFQPLPIRVYSGVNSKPIGQFFPFGAEFKGGAYIGSR